MDGMKTRLLKISSLLLFMILIIASCSPFNADDLDESGAGLEIGEDFEITAVDDGTTITLTFKAIPNAALYGYSVTTDNIIALSNENRTFSNGYYTYKVEKAQLEAAFGKAKAASQLRLYASTSSETPKWLFVKVFEIKVQIGDSVPDFIARARKEDSVRLEANSEVDPGNMAYKVDFNGQSVEFTSSQLPYTLEGIGKSAVALTISHKVTGDEEFGTGTQTLEVAEYDPRAVDSIRFTINEDGSLTLSDIPDNGNKNVCIFIDGTEEPFATDSYAESVTFPAETFGTGLFTANFKAAVYNESISEENAAVSTDPFTYTSKLTKQTETIGRQRYSVEIPVSEKMPAGYSISFSGSISDKLKSEPTESGIKIFTDDMALVSKTDYSFGLSINGNFLDNIEFKTESFAGEYIWNANGSGSGGNYATQFAVTVKDAENTKPGTELGYYVYTSDEDILYHTEGTEYYNNFSEVRISPMYDPTPALGESNDASRIDQSGYRWNNTKWNSSTYTAELISCTVTQINKDSTSSIVTSRSSGLPLVGSADAETTTQMTFKETNDNCYMVFYNEITGANKLESIVVDQGNDALRKNPNQNEIFCDEFGTNKGQFTYALVRQ